MAVEYTIPEGVTGHEWRKLERAANAVARIVQGYGETNLTTRMCIDVAVRSVGIGLNIGMNETGHVDFCTVLIDYVRAAGIWEVGGDHSGPMGAGKSASADAPGKDASDGPTPAGVAPARGDERESR